MIRFDASSHTYHKLSNGKRLHSVTQILARSGILDASWYGGVEYLDRGTVLHHITALLDAGEKVDMRKVPQRWRGFIPAWKRFRKETGFTPTLIEHPVAHLHETCKICSVVHEYSGTLDRLGHFSPEDTIPTVLDLKNHNSGRVGDWVRYQLVGYGHALKPSGFFNRVGVALHPDGTYVMTTFKVTDYMSDLERFLEATRTTLRGADWMKFRNGGVRYA